MSPATLPRPDFNIHRDIPVFDLEEEGAARFENTRAGLARLRRWLGFRPLARVVHEPTRSCHRLFEAGLTGHLPLCQGNPLQARRVALACGVRAKTGAVDSRMSARMGAAPDLVHDAPIPQKAVLRKNPARATAAQVRERTLFSHGRKGRQVSCSGASRPAFSAQDGVARSRCRRALSR
ncbi:hypothetical protein KY389_12345 [Paracoccus bogoriensis]|uniref:hypothetical protein n=1 Tax=Paracoccus bogoriensis TaxID=242065 RepID=UPI001CA4AFBD|nr:hypothetical protein [Paracoccus bogoriensis]MBW7057473.1 hypothetical protein [Paracoccus bogoriensis]